MESMNRVLVIDDDASIRESLEMYLQDKGLAVQTADTGNGGFRACLDYDPQVVILDIRLPDVSGLEILRRTCEDLPGSESHNDNSLSRHGKHYRSHAIRCL